VDFATYEIACAIVCSHITGPYNCASVQRALLAPEILNESFLKCRCFTALFVLSQFLARDSMLSALYAIARPSVCLSVCPSVTRVDQSKTVERIIEILSPSDRPNILVCRHQRSLRKSDGFTPNGGAKYKGGSKN